MTILKSAYAVFSYIFSPLVFIWGMLTIFEYDRFKPRTFNPDTDMKDLRGKVAVVTGANTGIGYGTAMHLARRGAKVYIACRDEKKAEAAISALEKDSKIIAQGGEVAFIQLDLLDPVSVKKGAQKFLTKEQRLDILVNNASLLISQVPTFYKGILDYMIVNHFSPFIFTRTLLPLMKKTATEPDSDVRIIGVSSDGHFNIPAKKRFRDLNDFNVDYEEYPFSYYMRYCATKLANVLFAKQLQRILDREGSSITVMSLHPGNVNTFSGSTPYPRIAYAIMSVIFMNIEVGAYTTAFAAASPLVKEQPQNYKGGYLQPICRLGKASVMACGEDLAEELWAATEKIIEEIGW